MGYRILMVCMGNICRSPTAHGVLQHKLEQAGLLEKIEVDSAGTHAWHRDEPPDFRATQHAMRRGYELQHLRARAVVPADFETFDLILAMDKDNLAWLMQNAPSAHREKIKLLCSYAAQSDAYEEIADPYYGGPNGFERVLDLVEDACDGLLDQLELQTAK
jgi:protein-tyrosine phosphatase